MKLNKERLESIQAAARGLCDSDDRTVQSIAQEAFEMATELLECRKTPSLAQVERWLGSKGLLCTGDTWYHERSSLCITSSALEVGIASLGEGVYDWIEILIKGDWKGHVPACWDKYTLIEPCRPW